MENSYEENSSKPASRLKSLLSQMVACLALDMMLIDLGMSITFIAVVIPDVLNAQEGLSLTEAQASWLGSIGFLFQPFGSIFSGPILDYFGRKNALLLVNVPHIIAWVLFYYCWNVPTLFIANVLLGIGTGFMEAPSVTYVSEVSDYSIRGMMTTLSQAFISTGVFISFLVGSVMPWRKAALCSIVAPISSMLLSVLIPDTPIWLLSKGRQKDALASLCKLRGWVKPEAVQEEFDELLKYKEQLQDCYICLKTDKNPSQCKHKKGNLIKNKFLNLRHIMLSQETLRPLVLVMAYFFFYAMSGLQAFKPNMINFCLSFGMDHDPKQIAIWVGLIFIFASITSAAGVKLLGKRKMVISTMLGSCLSSLSLTLYATFNLPSEVFSYDPTTFTAEKSYVPEVLFLMLVCFTALGLPWVILSEVFPFRSRGTATGISAALAYYMFFVVSKSNYDLELYMGLRGSLAVYTSCGFLGTIFLYFCLPETDKKTLIEVEDFFRGDYRIFADDWFINRFKKSKTVQNNTDIEFDSKERVVLIKLSEGS